jgi:hypothetical protein
MVWKINDYTADKKGFLNISDELGNKICDIFPFAGIGGVGLNQALENARKIVNAEKTFDALQGLIDWHEEGCPEGGSFSLTEAEAAIKNIKIVVKEN